MEEILILALNLWVAELTSKSARLKEDAEYDLRSAKRCPETIPVLSMLSMATGVTPATILEQIELRGRTLPAGTPIV